MLCALRHYYIRLKVTDGVRHETTQLGFSPQLSDTIASAVLAIPSSGPAVWLCSSCGFGICRRSGEAEQSPQVWVEIVNCNLLCNFSVIFLMLRVLDCTDYKHVAPEAAQFCQETLGPPTEGSQTACWCSMHLCLLPNGSQRTL